MKNLYKLVLIIITSLALSSYILQYNSSAKKALAGLLIKMPAFKNCTASFNINKINLVFPCLEIEDVKVIKKNKWSWEAKKIKIKFSWIQYLLKGKIPLNVELNNLNLSSNIENKNIKILKHIKKFLIVDKNAIKTSIEKLELNKCSASLLYEDAINIKLTFNMIAKDAQNSLRCNAWFSNLSIKQNGTNELIKNGSGTVEAILPNNENTINSTKKTEQQINIKSILNVPKLEEYGNFSINTKINGNELSGEIKSSENYLNIELTKFILGNDMEGDIKIKSKLDGLAKIKPEYQSYILNAELNSNIKFKNSTLDGSAILSNIGNEQFKLDQIVLNFKRDKNIEAKGTIKKGSNLFKFSIKKDNELDILISNQNSLLLKMPFQNIKVDRCDFHLNKKEDVIKLDINGLTEIDNIKKEFKFKSIYDNHLIDIFGFIGSKEILSKIKLADQRFEIKKIEIRDTKSTANNKNDKFKYDSLLGPKNNSNHLECFQKGDVLICQFSYDLIKKLIPEKFKNYITGSEFGTANLNLENFFNSNKKKIGMEIDLKNINIILPSSKNVIKDVKLESNINLNKMTLNIKKSQINLNKGDININYSKLVFSKNLGLDSALFNMTFNELHANYKEQVIGSFNGRINVTKNRNDRSKIKINVESENCSIKNLEFATVCKNPIISKSKSNSDFYIYFKSLKPIKFKNNKIEFNTLAKGKLSYEEEVLKYIGQININNGKIKFPYKSLKILKGELSFNEQESKINIYAKNKIKNHAISANIQGDFSNPTISLSSYPELSEEQISSILITGSTNSTLNIFIPTAIMGDMQNLIFKNENAEQELQTKKILKPLKHIKLISNVNNGNDISGGIEIDINDKLYAHIQKNISSDNETDVEIDYKISDHINLRGTKDKDGNTTGELELSWKI